MTLVFWFSRLRPGVSPQDYAAFIRKVDYPATERIASILNYESIQLRGPVTGEAPLPYQFIDLAEVTEIGAYRADLESHPAVQEVHGQFGRYVDTIANFVATPIGGGARRAK